MTADIRESANTTRNPGKQHEPLRQARFNTKKDRLTDISNSTKMDPTSSL